MRLSIHIRACCGREPDADIHSLCHTTTLCCDDVCISTWPNLTQLAAAEFAELEKAYRALLDPNIRGAIDDYLK